MHDFDKSCNFYISTGTIKVKYLKIETLYQ